MPPDVPPAVPLVLLMDPLSIPPPIVPFIEPLCDFIDLLFFDFIFFERMLDIACGSGPALVAARELTPDGEFVPDDPLVCAIAPAAMAPATTIAVIYFSILALLKW